MSLQPRNSAVENHIRKVFKFLEWKIKIRLEVFSGYDQHIVERNMFDQFPSLSAKAMSLLKRTYEESMQNVYGISLLRVSSSLMDKQEFLRYHAIQ